MGKTLDLGKRLELHPLDKHCQDISLGLYQRDEGGAPRFVIHTYDDSDEARKRVVFLTRTMAVFLGLEEIDDSPGWLRFACGHVHERALKRAFLDLCKLESSATLKPKPMTVADKKAGCDLSVSTGGDGVYEVTPADDSEAGQKRAMAVARGFAKLCEMESVAGSDTRVVFGCKTNHDALMGMIFYRAQNVRAAMQEAEQAASRGVLSAPSAQD